MTAFKIPVQPVMSQSFTVSFQREVFAWFRIFWVEAPEAGWTMDIGKDAVTPLVCGIPLLPGQNLIDQYPELHLPFIIYIDTPGDRKAVPRFEDLGILTNLYYATIDT